MSEEIIIKNGSPTLAGIKTASLFSCPVSPDENITASISSYNRMLIGKGLIMVPLGYIKGRVLIYMFRPKQLKKDLENQTAVNLLKKAGYKSASYQGLLAELRERVMEGGTFPHEIGLFLGYPAEDVSGFIENHAANYKLSGLWKVYGDVEKALRTFKLYDYCTRSYVRKLENGKTLAELAVAV